MNSLREMYERSGVLRTWSDQIQPSIAIDTVAAEVEPEITTGKFTLAEHDEEEHSLPRLRRWHQEPKARDIFGAPPRPTPTRPSESR